MRGTRLALHLLALSAGACSYDLDLLRGRPVDGGPDVAPPPDMPVVEPDRVQPDAAPEAAVDVAPDVPARMPMTGACALPGLQTVTASPTGVTVVEGDTAMGSTNTVVPMCTEGVAPSSARAYRYTVQSGTRLVATTNTGLCNAHDTVLAAYFSCAGSTGQAASGQSCNDDDMQNLCGACTGDGGVGGGCGRTNSTVELTGLVPGDVVYFVVNSYSPMGSSMRGRYRLAIAENGLTPVPAGATTAPIMSANRCACPTGTPMTGEVSFPRTGDVNQLGAMARSIFGRRDLPFRNVTGVSARLALSRFNLDTTGPCAVPGGAKAALDLLVGTTVVASAALGLSVNGSGAAPVTIPLTTFAPVSFGTPMGVQLQYQVRNIEPADRACVTVDVDLASALNTVTLLGSM